jgi:hypothetical protein
MHASVRGRREKERQEEKEERQEEKEAQEVLVLRQHLIFGVAG